MEQNFVVKIILLVVAMLEAATGVAQERNYINSQWWLQRPLINPAASGVGYTFQAAAGSRLGADNYDLGDGSLLYGRVDGKINAINSGIGFSYFNNNPEQLGNDGGNYNLRQRFLLNYNYQIEFANQTTLALGTSLEVIYNSWNILWLPPSNGNDPALTPPSGDGTDINIGFGAYYSGNNWHVGLSMVPAINLKDDNNLVDSENMYYFTAAYNFNITDKVSIEPGILAHTIHFKTSYNFNLKAWYDRAYYAGVGVNLDGDYPDSYDLLLGIQIIHGLSFQYAYNSIISDISSLIPNRHVISIVYQLPNR